MAGCYGCWYDECEDLTEVGMSAGREGSMSEGSSPGPSNLDWVGEHRYPYLSPPY